MEQNTMQESDEFEFIPLCSNCGEESDADVCDSCYDAWFEGDTDEWFERR